MFVSKLICGLCMFVNAEIINKKCKWKKNKNCLSMSCMSVVIRNQQRILREILKMSNALHIEMAYKMGLGL